MLRWPQVRLTQYILFGGCLGGSGDGKITTDIIATQVVTFN